MNKETHWYYFGETIYKTGRVHAACGALVDAKKDCDMHNPTCSDCKEAMKNYNKMEIE